jgi:hypothetical protein
VQRRELDKTPFFDPGDDQPNTNEFRDTFLTQYSDVTHQDDLEFREDELSIEYTRGVLFNREGIEFRKWQNEFGTSCLRGYRGVILKLTGSSSKISDF